MTDDRQFDLEEVDEELGSPVLTIKRAWVAGLVIGVLLLLVIARRRRRRARRLAVHRAVPFESNSVIAD